MPRARARACCGRATGCAFASSAARSSPSWRQASETASEKRPVSIRVLRPGLLTTLQDQVSTGLKRVGLCPGGAVDPVPLALANPLVGNAPDEAALEITVIGPELEFGEDTLVAVCGAEFQGSFPHNRPVLARKGTRFNVGRATRGA